MGRRRSKTKPHQSKKGTPAGARVATSVSTSTAAKLESADTDSAAAQAASQGPTHSGPTNTEPPASRVARVRQEPTAPKSRRSRLAREVVASPEARRGEGAREPAGLDGSLLLPRLAWIAAALACGLLVVPNMGLVSTTLAEQGPYAPHFSVALLAAGAIAGALGLLRPALLPLTLLGVVTCGFALTGLEDRSLSSAFHRSVPRVFGIGPELWLCIAWAALVATPPGRKGKHGAASVALMGFMWSLLSPTPVAGDVVPGVFGYAFDTVDTTERFGRTLLPWLHIGVAVLGFMACASQRLRARLGQHGLLALFAGWALLSGVLSSEGWVKPLWELPVVSHLVVRTASLCALVLGSSVLLRRGTALFERRYVVPLLSAAIALCYLLVQTETWHWSKADENVYFYAARAMSWGALPYADYFYAHPPLRVFLPGSLFAVLGFSIWTAKLIPALSAVCSGYCVGRIVEQVVDAPGRRWWGLFAMALFLGTERTLTASTEFSGVNLATALLSVALLLAYRGKPVASGLLAATAQGVGMIVSWMLPMLFLVVWLRARALRAPAESAPRATSRGRWQALGARLLRSLRPVLPFVAAWASGALLLLGIGIALGGDDFITQVFRYHSLKAAIYSEHLELGSNPLNWPVVAFKNLGLLIESDEIRKPIDNNLAAWLGGAVAALTLPWVLWLHRYVGKKAAREELPRQFANWVPLLLGGLLALIFMGLLKEIYRYYWAALIPLFTILAVLGLAQVGKAMAQRPLTAVSFGLLVLLLPARAFAHWGLIYPKSVEERYPGNLVELPYRSTSPVPALDSFMASVFYKPFLVRSELEAPLHRSYWNKKKELSVAQELADVINDRVPAGRTITGSSTIAPLVALLAERRMADDQVDTNAKVLKSGLRDNREFWKAMCDDGVAAIIAGGGMFSDRYMKVGLPVRDQFERVHRVKDAMTRYRNGGLTMDVWVLKADREKCEL